MIPGDRRYVPPGTGDKFEANQPAKAINLKITYTIGRDTPPMVYVKKGADLEFKIDVVLAPKPRGRVEEPVWDNASQRNKDIADNPIGSIGFEKITTMVAWTIIGIGLAVFALI